MALPVADAPASSTTNERRPAAPSWWATLQADKAKAREAAAARDKQLARIEPGLTERDADLPLSLTDAAGGEPEQPAREPTPAAKPINRAQPIGDRPKLIDARTIEPRREPPRKRVKEPDDDWRRRILQW